MYQHPEYQDAFVFITVITKPECTETGEYVRVSNRKLICMYHVYELIDALELETLNP
jgi:hypothetical protein